MMLVSTIGNTARLPLAAGPMRKLNVITVPTSSATMPARNTRSYQRRCTRGIGAWRNGARQPERKPDHDDVQHDRRDKRPGHRARIAHISANQTA